MDKDIRQRVKACHLCGLSKSAQNSKLDLLTSEVAERPLQKIFIDYVGKLPRSKEGHTALLVCVDAFSKFVWLIPVRGMTSRATIKALRERIFSSFSVPEILVTDNAQYFVSREFRDFCFSLGIKHVTTSPYYPKPSHAERFNRNLRAALIAFHMNAQNTWDQNLVWLQVAFNSAEHEATKTCPFAVVFPFRAASPLLNQWRIQDLLPDKVNSRLLRQRWKAVKVNSGKSHARMATRYKDRIPQPFQVGDVVYCKNHPISDAGRKISAKLLPRWKGPFKIDAFLTPVTVRLVDLDKDKYVTRAHVSHLKTGSRITE
jgi:transposase InsO family protein